MLNPLLNSRCSPPCVPHPPPDIRPQARFIEPRYLVLGIIGYVVYLLCHRLVLWPYFRSPLRKVPGPPLGHPLFGQSGTIMRSETGIPQREWVKQYGPVVRVIGPVGVERMIFMRPEALYQILVEDWLEYPRPTFLRNILGLVSGYGLLTVTGNEHKQMRRAMNPAFSIANLMAQIPMYFEPIDGLVNILKSEIKSEEGKEIQVYDWLSKVTLDIICETAFGYKADSLHNPHNELAEAYEQLLSLQSGPNLAKFILLVSLPGGPRFLASDWAYNRRHWLAKLPIFGKLSVHCPLADSVLPHASGLVSQLVDAMYRIRKISARMLEEKMRDSDVVLNDSDAKRDIMSILVRARKTELDGGKGEYVMSDRAMMDQVLTFLGAGHETTASGLTWTLWHLSNNLDVQQRLRDELRPIFAKNARPDYRTLKDLQWLDCVVMESLRVMPPVPLTVRVAAKTDYIDGVLVPKGTLITIPIRVVNTWKEVWGEDAERCGLVHLGFNPARWLSLPKDHHPTFSMLSFIAGPHACIGKTMAIIEMKAVLAALIVNFEFEPAFPGQVPKPAAAITIKPTDGMPLRVRRVSTPSEF